MEERAPHTLVAARSQLYRSTIVLARSIETTSARPASRQDYKQKPHRQSVTLHPYTVTVTACLYSSSSSRGHKQASSKTKAGARGGCIQATKHSNQFSHSRQLRTTITTRHRVTIYRQEAGTAPRRAPYRVMKLCAVVKPCQRLFVTRPSLPKWGTRSKP